MNTKALKKDHVKERAPPWSIKLAKEGGRQDPFAKPITRVKGQRTQPAKAQTHADNQVLTAQVTPLSLISHSLSLSLYSTLASVRPREFAVHVSHL